MNSLAIKPLLLIPIIALATLSLAQSETDAAVPTPYEAAASSEVERVQPMAWTCGSWSSWETLAIYCTNTSVCPNGCPVRARLLMRFRVCTDEAGNEYRHEEQVEEYYGCCSGEPGGQCIDPIMPPGHEEVIGGQ